MPLLSTINANQLPIMNLDYRACHALVFISIPAVFSLSLLSHEEAGRYLEVYKAYENKPPTEIMGRVNNDFTSQVPLVFMNLGR